MCVASLDIDREHVRDVEHACITAHGKVFLDLGTVAHRHVPAAEIDHLCAGGAMHGVEWSLLQQDISQATKEGEANSRASPRLSFYLRDYGAHRDDAAPVPLRWADRLFAYQPLSRWFVTARAVLFA
jgi:hypothetical protein